MRRLDSEPVGLGVGGVGDRAACPPCSSGMPGPPPAWPSPCYFRRLGPLGLLPFRAHGELGRQNAFDGLLARLDNQAS